LIMETVRARIEQHADASPDREFLIAPESGDSLSFAQLKMAADDVGQQLDQLGLPQGAKVAFLLNNGYWTLRLFLGVMSSNRIIVPLNAVAGTVQLVHVLDHSDSEVVFVAPEYRDKLRGTRVSGQARRNHGANRAPDPGHRNHRRGWAGLARQ
jgi:long-chain acyl-CoA synthetase